MHKYIHTYVHTNIQILVHTSMHACLHTYTYTHAHIHTYTLRQTQTHTYNLSHTLQTPTETGDATPAERGATNHRSANEEARAIQAKKAAKNHSKLSCFPVTWMMAPNG